MGSDDIAGRQLSAYQPRELDIVCRRCQRHGSMKTVTLKSRYVDQTLGDIARLVAADGDPACALAAMGGDGCSVLPIEPPFEQWATLSEARLGRWVGWLTCGRRRAGLKATRSCPGEFMVDVHSLLMVLPWEFPLAKLPTRLTCPECQTRHVVIRWEQMAPPPAASRAIMRKSGGMGRGGLRLVRKAS